jgi:outer membrane protein, heavy metal efflux system
MNRRMRSLCAGGALLVTSPSTLAQAPAAAVSQPSEAASLTLDSYLKRVVAGNYDLIAQRTTLTTAEAQIAIAKIFPDPELTAGLLAYDVTHQGNPTSAIVSLGVPLQIGGQRGARVDVAEAGLSAARAELEDFLRGLRAKAATGYADALHARLVQLRKERTLESLSRLVAVNEQRLRAGDIGESALLQSRVEAQQFRAAVLQAEGDVRQADLTIISLLGSQSNAFMGRKLDLEGDLRRAAERTFEPEALVASAIATRPDLKATERRLDAAAKQVELAHRNRIIDVTIAATWQHNFSVNSPAPIPSADLFGGTLSVPIPFSRLYKGELTAAYASRAQADATFRGTRVKVEVEVRQAIAGYEAASARVKLYTGGVLSDADQVLEKTLYNYQRGGATLVEVLVAQRTVDDVYLSYYDALADAAHALINLEQAIGRWDLQF